MSRESAYQMKEILISTWQAITVQRRLPRLAGGLTVLLVFVLAISLRQPATAEENQYLTGQLLVATPEMKDPRFFQAVIYMVRHSEDGAMGLVINRPVGIGPISELLKGLGVESEGAKGKIVLHYGGPVERGKGFVLHTKDYIKGATQVVDDRFAVTADIKILQAIAHGKGPKHSLVIMGYAGWAPRQLEAEIKAGGWFSIAAEEGLVFDKEAEDKWERARARRKIKI